MLDLIKGLIDFILHIDKHLAEIIRDYGTWTYGILFLIIFAETGFVVTPFLPGDSLLFMAGYFAHLSSNGLNIHLLAFLLFIAAVLGDTVNYWIGAYMGPKVFKREDSRWLRKKHLERAHAFFEKYGGRAIILARFVPFIRTFVPFVAGVGKMTYPRFIAYNVIGGFVWIYFFTYMGYFFGELLKDKFGLIVICIILISLVPIIFETIRSWRESKKEKNGQE